MTDFLPVTGATLMAWGYPPGPWFKGAIQAAEQARKDGASEPAVRAIIDRHRPSDPLPLRAMDTLPFSLLIKAANEEEAANVVAVSRHMAELMRVPTVVAGAVMPDACPAGSAPGTIPVGGVVATKEAIHPGMHSADICCSVAITTLNCGVDPTALLDAGMKLSHFGMGGRPRGEQWKPPVDVMAAAEANPFLQRFLSSMIEHFGTQGDGNHFLYVGRVASTGEIALVTHHGSRKPAPCSTRPAWSSLRGSAETCRQRPGRIMHGFRPRAAKGRTIGKLSR